MHEIMREDISLVDCNNFFIDMFHYMTHIPLNGTKNADQREMHIKQNKDKSCRSSRTNTY